MSVGADESHTPSAPTIEVIANGVLVRFEDGTDATPSDWYHLDDVSLCAVRQGAAPI